MDRIGLSDQTGRTIGDTFVLGRGEPYNDPECKHLRTIEVEDPMPGVIAYQCVNCMVGWLVKITKENTHGTREPDPNK